jgi:DNA-binding transcriptional LysR family regulator
MWSHIDEVEKFLGLVLIKRGRPSYLTVDGLRFLPIARQLVVSFESEFSQLHSKSYEAKGELVVSTTLAFVTWLVPSIKEFHDLYPNFKIYIVAEDNLSETSLNEADVLLRPFEKDIPKNFQSHWHIHYRLALFASRAYVAKYGTPRKPEDLKDHCILAYGQSFHGVPDLDWHLQGKKYGLPDLTPTLKINSTRALFDAACHGIGIVSNPIESLSIYHTDLVHILPDITGPALDTRFCTRISEEEQKTANMRIFSSFFEKNLPPLGITITADKENTTAQGKSIL